MKIRRFEDAEVWRLSRQLSKKVYQLTNSGELAKDYSFRDQLRRSAISIMANIAEGFERNTTKEFLHFLYIAKGSAGEVRSHLHIASDIDYIDDMQFKDLFSSVEAISKSLSGFIKNLSGTTQKKT